MGKSSFFLGEQVVNKPICLCVMVDRTAPIGGGDVTVTGDELLTDATAILAAKYPTLVLDAGQEWAIQTITPAAYVKGTAVTDCQTQVETDTAITEELDVTCAAKVSNVNPNGQRTYGTDLLDLDCNGESDFVIDPAGFETLITDGSAGAFGVCLTPVTAVEG